MWWNGFEKHGFVTLRHEVYRALLEAVNEPLLEEEGAKAGRLLTNYLIRKYKRLDLEVLLDYVLTLASQFGLGRLRTKQAGTKYVIVMYHDYGSRHSIFLRAIWDAAVKRITGTIPKTEVSERMIMSELEISPIPLYKLT